MIDYIFTPIMGQNDHLKISRTHRSKKKLLIEKINLKNVSSVKFILS